jgi:hypothetical protein
MEGALHDCESISIMCNESIFVLRLKKLKINIEYEEDEGSGGKQIGAREMEGTHILTKKWFTCSF